MVDVEICAVGGESGICEGCGYDRSGGATTETLRDSVDCEGRAGQRGQLVVRDRVSQVLGRNRRVPGPLLLPVEDGVHGFGASLATPCPSRNQPGDWLASPQILQYYVLA